MVFQRLFTVVLVLAAFAPVATDAQQAPERDVFAFVRALDDAGARDVWPGFNPSEWPVALFDGQQTILLRHPSPPPEFAPMPGRPGVLAMPGRHPAVVGNSTREIGGVRTATVIATPDQEVESTMLACVEEVFHVFWLSRHANFRPNEMARYAYPVKDSRNLQRILAEDEALARALEAEDLAAGGRMGGRGDPDPPRADAPAVRRRSRVRDGTRDDGGDGQLRRQGRGRPEGARRPRRACAPNGRPIRSGGASTTRARRCAFCWTGSSPTGRPASTASSNEPPPTFSKQPSRA